MLNLYEIIMFFDEGFEWKYIVCCNNDYYIFKD